MAARPENPTLLLLRDELVGFAKSKVMLILWLVLPAIAVLGYLVLPARAFQEAGFGGAKLSATAFMSLILSSIAGTVAALMVAVDLVSERNRKVYDLFVIRPIPRSAIIWAKFIAVFGCVSVACLVAMLAGITVDWIRGEPLDGDMMYDAVKSLVSLTSVIALSAGVGVLFGVWARTILVAVILILYVGQNLAVVPMLPVYLGVLPDKFWVFIGISGVLVLALMWLAGWIFKRAQF